MVCELNGVNISPQYDLPDLRGRRGRQSLRYPKSSRLPFRTPLSFSPEGQLSLRRRFGAIRPPEARAEFPEKPLVLQNGDIFYGPLASCYRIKGEYLGSFSQQDLFWSADCGLRPIGAYAPEGLRILYLFQRLSFLMGDVGNFVNL